MEYPDDPNALVLQTDKKVNKIITFRHPEYDTESKLWSIYRDVYEGGKNFLKYVEKFSQRESDPEFQTRKNVTPIAAFAKANVNMIKNAISQRIWEITRKDGPKTYMDAVEGDKWGVDLLGNSMNSFINKEILPDLLAIRKVGVFVDSPELSENPTLAEGITKRPYIYVYRAEDILAWTPDETDEPNKFSSLLLRENYLELDADSGLPIGYKYKYRHVRKQADGVHVYFYNSVGEPCDKFGNKTGKTTYKISIPVVPFVVFELSQSMLTDVYSYQIALVNLASSDINYAMRSNFPFYVEQFDPRSMGNDGIIKTGSAPQNNQVVDGVIRGTQKPANMNAATEAAVGVSTGRRYPLGTNEPSFIHPSPEPLKVSMEKQTQLKMEIRDLLHVTLANITAGSVELQSQDRRQTLEAGLNNIGLELQQGERAISTIWGMYEKSENKIVLNYPKNYNLKTEKERREEAKEINELKTSVPSLLFQKECGKDIVTVLMQAKVSPERLAEMHEEIDEAPTMTSDHEEIKSDCELGLVSDETASFARGYGKGEVAKAKADHADRIARIQAAQTSINAGARGVDDKSVNPNEARDEKRLANTGKDGRELGKERGNAD